MNTDRSQPGGDREPASRIQGLLSWDRLGFRLLVFGCMGLFWILQGRIFGRPWMALIQSEVVATLPWAFAAPIVGLIRRRTRGGGWLRALATHLLGLAGFYLFYWMVRELVALCWMGAALPWIPFRPGGLVPAFPQVMTTLGQSPFMYLIILLGMEATRQAQARRAEAEQHLEVQQEQARQAAQLKGQLAEARLALLQRQINPHFVFNALQAVSTLLHRDPEAANDVVEGLADLLRAMLEEGECGTWSLGKELDLTRRYLEIEQVRFGKRLTIGWDLAPDLDAPVPRLVLMPLVENAIRHGLSGKVGPAHLDITVRGEDGVLRLEVADDGQGAAEPLKLGVGLGNTRERLATLYGDAAGLHTETIPGGGFRAWLHLPLSGRAT